MARTQAQPPICDLSLLNKLTYHDAQLKEQLIGLYMEASEDVAKNLPLQYQEKKFENLRATLHKFLSTAKTFGIKKLSKPIHTILSREDPKQLETLKIEGLLFDILDAIRLSRHELGQLQYNANNTAEMPSDQIQ